MIDPEFEKNASNFKVKRFITNRLRSRSQGLKCWQLRKDIVTRYIFMWSIKALVLTVLKLLSRIKFSKNRSSSNVKVTGYKNVGTQERSCHYEITWNNKALAFTVRMLLSKLKFHTNLRMTGRTNTIPPPPHFPIFVFFVFFLKKKYKY